MPGRIVLFGATGYTGELTARALVARGAAPVLAARTRERVEALASELGGLETAVADVAGVGGVGGSESVAALVQSGDVLVSTVGPFAQWGGPAVQAAIAAGAHYLDSTGEAPFIRDVFERHGPAAEAAGCGLVTAFGYDWIPGNLAGALALRDAGPDAVRVDIGYYMTGAAGAKSLSGGTRASAAGALTSPSFTFADGRVVTERGARRVREFDVAGRSRPAISVGSSEHFALPRLHEGLRDVGTWLGWFGPLSRPLQVLSAAGAVASKVPGYERAVQGLAARYVKGSSGGPDTAARARTGSSIIALASDGRGAPLAAVRLEGVNAYDFTAEMLAWGSMRALDGGLRGTGALGPVDGFGLDELEAGAAGAGISRV